MNEHVEQQADRQLRWTIREVSEHGIDPDDADAFRGRMDFSPCEVVEEVELAESLWAIEKQYGRTAAWQHLMNEAEERGGLYVVQ